MSKKAEVTTVGTQPGETFEVRCASAATNVKVCFQDGTEIAIAMGPGQVVAITRGTEMIPTVYLEDPDAAVGDIRLIEPNT